MCVITASLQTVCVGANTHLETQVPAAVFVDVSVGSVSGSEFPCGIDIGGSILCWGTPPIAATPSGSFARVSCSYLAFYCALSRSGRFVSVTAGNSAVGLLDSTGLHVAWGTAPLIGQFAQQANHRSDDMCAILQGSGVAVCLGELLPGTFVETAVDPDQGFAIGITSAGDVAIAGSRLTSLAPQGSFVMLDHRGGMGCGAASSGAVVCWQGGPLWMPSSPHPVVAVSFHYRNSACLLDNTNAVHCQMDSSTPVVPAGTYSAVGCGECQHWVRVA